MPQWMLDVVGYLMSDDGLCYIAFLFHDISSSEFRIHRVLRLTFSEIERFERKPLWEKQAVTAIAVCRLLTILFLKHSISSTISPHYASS